MNSHSEDDESGQRDAGALHPKLELEGAMLSSSEAEPSIPQVRF